MKGSRRPHDGRDFLGERQPGFDRQVRGWDSDLFRGLYGEAERTLQLRRPGYTPPQGPGGEAGDGPDPPGVSPSSALRLFIVFTFRCR